MKSDRKGSFGDVVLDSDFAISKDEGSILEQMFIRKYLFDKDLHVKKSLKKCISKVFSSKYLIDNLYKRPCECFPR